MVGRRGGVVLAMVLAVGGCTATAAPPSPAASTGTVRERIAALVLRQVAFGSVSLIPVRFAHSRIAGPFEDGSRRLYCVSTRMSGRTFGKPERPKLVLREEAGALTVLRDEEETCEGHRSEPFAELDSPVS
ncbi:MULTISPECIES: hypothetical protein [Methylorubrum]|jgi:hypothetical protein|uniref:Lipoprotein n=2 Tax=Methylorubrum extorquens TaxID=408 RepID=C5AWB3_METEA|nr:MULTISPECIES: hypothetical protein [Methylorubrum]ACS38741.1 hypothetical protein; putative exported protein [Methylorubrum extorquens AM1]EHP92348.1 hypothetical protein MetexDRAFT_2774 [Methylorubrum extorquens DSM 13060]MCP1543187.1 hypothetical protein [Methylorubrum extorquens]MCP1589468.1 hypothetical protein [Methylorubrum extorquens]BDL38310.1 hypothetical protein MSPGM_09000 [Methylorubrum sp. GM97]